MKTKSKAVLGIAKMTPEGKVVTTQNIINAMQASGNFPDANMPIKYATLQTLNTDLHNAIVAANNGSTAATSQMHEEERKLTMAFNLIKMHVEIVSNNAADPDTVILSSGMGLSGNSGQIAVTDLTVDAIGNGIVQIRVPRTIAEKAFCYQYALASDPNNWQNIGFYSLSKIQFPNQTPGSQLIFAMPALPRTGWDPLAPPNRLWRCNTPKPYIYIYRSSPVADRWGLCFKDRDYRK